MFNNLITKVITTALVIPMGFASVSPAKAADCVYGEGYQLCMESNGYNNWNLTLRNNNTVENMTVQCYGKEVDSWRSHGGLSKSEAQYMASYFCSL